MGSNQKDGKMTLNWNNLIAEYLQNNRDLNNWRSENSLKTYKKNLFAFCSWLSAERVKKPRNHHIVKYLRQKLREGCAPAYLNTILSVLRQFYVWCEAQEVYADITKGVKNFKQYKTHKRQALTRGQIVRFFLQFRESDASYRLIFEIMLVTGIRRQSLCSLQVKHLLVRESESGEKTHWLAVRQKGRDSHDHAVPISADLAVRLQKHISGLSKNQRMFDVAEDQLTRDFRRFADAAGLYGPEITLHSLRHTCATLALRLGGTIESASDMLGHASVKTTADIYAHRKEDGKVGLSGVLSGALQEMLKSVEIEGNKKLNGAG